MNLELNEFRVIAVGLICMVSSFAAASSDAKVISTALECMARQPEIEGRLFTSMLIGVGLLESIPIIAVVIAFMLLGGVK
ncbi:ATP synthase F0 subcomplex C subunit [Hydrogenispora ethanolica]|uniref:ATP synthase F(0) sector subunit c n=1 Tax=Hydrogenispora ethanolica TaxID=1082276 RepID=A0A4R1RB71_HYDET|nr:ATP synthase F0 subunit C [Hydrogenispora ethanolica]TCL63024.1 ATP synthase F0 subcomplex C subunit [Hydrogenispora ethanolica]